ncbi:MAG: hypothetical protein WBG86_17015 [Polyangiales bacterium]
MENGDDAPIRKGDRGFVLRLALAGLALVLFTLVLFDVLDGSNLGGCAARGFLEVTETPPSH